MDNLNLEVQTFKKRGAECTQFAAADCVQTYRYMEGENKTVKVGEHMHGMGSVPVAGEDRGFCAIASEAIFCPSTGPLPVPHH